MKKIILILISVALLSCSGNEVNLVEKEVTNPRVLVLGNSITKCSPVGEWNNNWGMAASSPDKDFCYLIEKGLNAKSLNRLNISVWENNFFCEEQYYKILPTINYDFIIVKVGENVENVKEFKVELKNLLNYYKNFGNKIILVTTIWSQYSFDENGNPFEVVSDRDRIIKEVSFENNFTLVDISEMKIDPKYYAWEEYSDSSIGSHPNDLGMKYISDKILESIK
mgnify:CR=1 FL=1